MSIEFDGLDDVLKSLSDPIDPGRLEKTLMKACLLVETAAREKAPKGKTGDLARSITSRVEDNAGIVYTPLEYAPYVEYGTGLFAEGGNGRKDVPWAYEDEETGELIWTSGQHPQPYMRPALDENREEIKRILREGLLND
jgi:HK97 gp10 family phage protein